MTVDATVAQPARRVRPVSGAPAQLPDPDASTARRSVAAGMRAHACVATTLAGSDARHPRTRVTTLRSAPPLTLRLAAKAPEPWAAHAIDAARVCLTAGAAGPVGGDQLTLHVDVGRGSALVLSEVSPTLLLPGPHGEPSVLRVRIRVAADAKLVWLPEAVIASRGCDHLTDVRVDLEDGARLLMREEVLLGRHGEPGGRVCQRVAVRLAGRPLYRQDLLIGAADTRSPAVLGHFRAVGSTVVVDPRWVCEAPPVQRLSGAAALLPLAGPAAVVTALADDNLQLRAQLEQGLAALGPPGGPGGAPRP
jgi:urease accessory protein